MSEEDRVWIREMLDDLLHGRPTKIHPAPAMCIARDAPEGGLAWLSLLAHSTAATDHSRAAACHMLAQEGEQPPVEVLRALLASDNCWARFHAALASRGPWASLLVRQLELALNDTTVLSDLDHIYRVSDLVALALVQVDRPPHSEALRNWFSAVRADLTSTDATARDLATFVLAEIGDVDARTQLQCVAAEEGEFQAQFLLERLHGKNTA
jgi:hypothetical protein